MTVRALTVRPGVAGSAGVDEVDEPAGDGSGYVVAPLLIGVCGTDAEIIGGGYGEAPAGADRLVLGHECVGRVVSAPDGAELAAGDLVVPIVRRPDPVPCPSCAAGEWDMCRNGRYTEHGIRGAHGFARERFPLEPDFAVAVPDDLGDLAVLVEPTSVVAKAWEQIERIGGRTTWTPRCVLVTGAGPIGLLAALLARQRGLETHVLDRVADGPKPDLVAGLGAEYHTGAVTDLGIAPDVVIECTGVGQLVLDAMACTSTSGIVCLTGISSGARAVELDASALNKRMVLENDVVFGSVNANRRHYEAAIEGLAAADRGWLGGVVTRRVPLERWSEAIEKRPGDVKTTIAFGPAT